MKKKIRFCPKCLSAKIRPDLSATAIGRGSIFNQYKCLNCGYTEIFFPEADEKEYKKIKNEFKNKKRK